MSFSDTVHPPSLVIHQVPDDSVDTQTMARSTSNDVYTAAAITSHDEADKESVSDVNWLRTTKKAGSLKQHLSDKLLRPAP